MLWFTFSAVLLVAEGIGVKEDEGLVPTTLIPSLDLAQSSLQWVFLPPVWSIPTHLCASLQNDFSKMQI